MPQAKKPAQQTGRKAIRADQAMRAANAYILFHYPTLFTGAIPRRLKLPSADVWVVPIVLTSPGYGIVGEAGPVAVDAHSGEVVPSECSSPTPSRRARTTSPVSSQPTRWARDRERPGATEIRTLPGRCTSASSRRCPFHATHV